MRTSCGTASVAFALVLMTGVTPALAQTDGTVRGQIVAAADGSIVERASVTLKAAGSDRWLETTTDAAGRFVFARIGPGELIVAAAASGFAAREITITLAPREAAVVRMQLQVAGLSARVQVVARATGTRSPAATTLTSERLESMAAFERTTLTDAIVTTAPGMIRGHDDFVHIRGHEVALNPSIDGVSFWENAHALFSAGVNPDVVETATVMTGGFPAEYGNRFGGAVDISTKSGPRARDRGGVSFSAGDAGRRRMAAEGGGERGRLGYYIVGSAFASDRFLSPPETIARHDSARGGHGFVRVDRAIGSSSGLTALAMGDGVNMEIPIAARDADLRPLARASQRTRQQTAIVGFRHAWSSATANVSGYQRFSRVRLQPAAGPLTAQADVQRDLLTLGVKADVARASGRHAVKAGADVVRLRPVEALAYNYGGYRELTHLLELPHIHVAGQAIAFSGRETGGQVSAYAQDSIQLSSRVTADVGVRVDRYSLVVSEAHASPRAALAVDAGLGATLHASYNHFFVPPPIEGVLSSSAGLTRSINEIGVALPALEPTVEDQIELGVSRPWRAARISAAGYYRRSDNPVHTTVWPDSRIYSYASFDRARAYGLELKGEVAAVTRGVTGYLNYALGRVDFVNPVTGGFITDAAHLTDTSRFPAPMDQRHTLTGGVTYTHAGTGLFAATTMEYGSGTPIGHGGAEHEHGDGSGHEHAAAAAALRVPQHVTANAGVGIGLLRRASGRSALTLRIDVENVSNRPYVIARESAFSPPQYSKPRLVSATTRVSW